ncbi:Retinal rod rhodopsin-sensitive cGMP 3',5'-cyclic phosphodiesterase subunit gamma [Triplophysa tibetana]|uniref:Retinal rod rhodopsin-sensitive cGMP 3',5'-cyclic phosphodiesterase subunit gamma n=1 Tax=Triplophysa tibetana TaxID=1572043 RepID=A0A5A9N9A6_9TELE|nr:Retinal rod rhodopsin-sensitive cGMP 3',5'-cyclic phosphodiesterase subunit gamma [Triplophysa tibetana]
MNTAALRKVFIALSELRRLIGVLSYSGPNEVLQSAVDADVKEGLHSVQIMKVAYQETEFTNHNSTRLETYMQLQKETFGLRTNALRNIFRDDIPGMDGLGTGGYRSYAVCVLIVLRCFVLLCDIMLSPLLSQSDFSHCLANRGASYANLSHTQTSPWCVPGKLSAIWSCTSLPSMVLSEEEAKFLGEDVSLAVKWIRHCLWIPPEGCCISGHLPLYSTANRRCIQRMHETFIKTAVQEEIAL